ncbi:hypothetical protein BT63DRAFT_460220 [Microthyrium microscopicum]|uniref:Uncharacterized protein n=1 Tax=Microthyrium microscopicum TaxID=703497 RepID=A0A6A6TZX8_9PEZI|nr:hypothetical protein BT63DRAFT_460220 [Microthyrium microscopicum]
MIRNILEKLQSRLELRQLEDKYILRKDRVCYQSTATYVNGEYVYAPPYDPSAASLRSQTTSRPGRTSKRSSSRDTSYSASTSTSSQNTNRSNSRWSRQWDGTNPFPSIGNWRR